MNSSGIARSTHFAGLDAVRARVAALARASVEVGVPAGPKYPDGTSVAQVFAYVEFGTETIPERPALRTGLKRALPGAKALNRSNLKAVIDGRMAAGIALGQLGEYAVGEVRRAMIEGPWEPNAPSTIRKKKSDRPWIDSGQAIQSVTSRVVMG